ncbi:histone deacetylase [Streptomyces yaizuensis]|uniref:Histone deacetylase n=1 Tax=Streptomyces yaizuensis TaxID=2989713 RepID=A0ABQ5P1Q2_9ACTN|nr:histone deacetylase [Streptomyces sp. YSPA8]GLF96527.1 histone deacetylase [Streptomyces sp. YSPA8]
MSTTVHRPGARPPGPARQPERVWYAAYGSNMDPARLHHYLVGGRPPGSARSCPGCREHRPPADSVPVELPGVLYFATESAVWGGGRAFYDPDAPDTPGGPVRMVARLITARQFSDIAAQEMYRSPGTDLDLRSVIEEGREELGPGRYETLLCPGFLDGLPLLTFTAPWGYADVAWNRPSAAYLRHLAAGLLTAGAWDAGDIARYLAAAPGAAGAWTPAAVTGLLAPS